MSIYSFIVVVSSQYIMVATTRRKGRKAKTKKGKATPRSRGVRKAKAPPRLRKAKKAKAKKARPKARIKKRGKGVGFNIQNNQDKAENEALAEDWNMWQKYTGGLDLDKYPNPDDQFDIPDPRDPEFWKKPAGERGKLVPKFKSPQQIDQEKAEAAEAADLQKRGGVLVKKLQDFILDSTAGYPRYDKNNLAPKEGYTEGFEQWKEEYNRGGATTKCVFL
jgi:hypothetical protein